MASGQVPLPGGATADDLADGKSGAMPTRSTADGCLSWMLACLRTLVPLYALDIKGCAQKQILVSVGTTASNGFDSASGASNAAATTATTAAVAHASLTSEKGSSERRHLLRPNWSLLMGLLSTYAGALGCLGADLGGASSAVASARTGLRASERCLVLLLRSCCELSAVGPPTQCVCASLSGAGFVYPCLPLRLHEPRPSPPAV